MSRARPPVARRVAGVAWRPYLSSRLTRGGRKGGPPPRWRWPARDYCAAFFTSGQLDLDSGMKASSPGSVATSL